MRFVCICGKEAAKAELSSEFKAGHEIGNIGLGKSYLFFKKGFSKYYINYSDLKCAFRRVMLVPAKMCCGKGNLQVDYLVLSDGVNELAQVQLPGHNAAKLLMEELKVKSPETSLICPENLKSSKDMKDKSNTNE